MENARVILQGQNPPLFSLFLNMNKLHHPGIMKSASEDLSASAHLGKPLSSSRYEVESFRGLERGVVDKESSIEADFVETYTVSSTSASSSSLVAMPTEKNAAAVTKNHSNHKESIAAMRISNHASTFENVNLKVSGTGFYDSLRGSSDAVESRDDEPVTCNDAISSQREPSASQEIRNGSILAANRDGTKDQDVVASLSTFLESNVVPVITPSSAERSGLCGTFRQNESPRTNTVSKASQVIWMPQKTMSKSHGLPPRSPQRNDGGRNVKLVSPGSTQSTTKETKRSSSQTTSPPHQQPARSAPTKSHAQRDKPLQTIHDTINVANAELQRRLLEHGSDHCKVGQTWNEIGYLHSRNGNFGKAYRSHLQAIKCKRGRYKYPRDTLHISYAQHSIGILHLRKRDLAKSIDRFDAALDLFLEFQNQHGRDPETETAIATIRYTLGVVLTVAKDYSDALYELTEALRTQLRIMGPRSVDVVETIGALDELHRLCGNATQSMECRRVAKAIRNGITVDSCSPCEQILSQDELTSQIAALVHSGKASLTMTSATRPDDKGLTPRVTTQSNTPVGSAYVSLKSLSPPGVRLSKAKSTLWFQHDDDDDSCDATEDCLCSGPLDIVAQALQSLACWIGDRMTEVEMKME